MQNLEWGDDGDGERKRGRMRRGRIRRSDGACSPDGVIIIISEEGTSLPQAPYLPRTAEQLFSQKSPFLFAETAMSNIWLF